VPFTGCCRFIAGRIKGCGDTFSVTDEKTHIGFFQMMEKRVGTRKLVQNGLDFSQGLEIPKVRLGRKLINRA
jgi:hypothetical protein